MCAKLQATRITDEPKRNNENQKPVVPGLDSRRSIVLQLWKTQFEYRSSEVGNQTPGSVAAPSGRKLGLLVGYGDCLEGGK